MRRILFIAAAMTLGTTGAVITTPTTVAWAAGSRRLVSAGTTSLIAAAPGDGDTLSATEFPAGLDEGRDESAPVPPDFSKAVKVDGVSVRAAGAEVQASFNGLNFRQQRVANGGNQFSVEPPDQGLCVGNGFVLESVNDVLRVFDTAGNPLTGVIDLNTFHGYPAQINRTTGVQGPFVTDPTCYYDPTVQRWFHVVLTLDVDPATGDFVGSNHLDLAVSTSASPLDPWRIYRLAVQDDGTDGTPDHGCSGAPDGTGHGPCLGDYPHIGADANGIYLTTNEYSFLGGSEFHSAQIYAISKAQLVAGVTSPLVTQFDTAVDASTKGFTIWPASAPVGGNESGRGGTEYFLSGLVSNQSAPPPETPFGSSNRVLAWALTNTSSLNSASPSLKLSTASSEVGTYSTPPSADQKAGDFPLGQCLNDTTLFGAGCWQLLVAAKPPTEVLSKLDGNDGRMQQVTFYKGQLYGALDTAVRVEGKNGSTSVKSGIEWFVIRPKFEDDGLKAETKRNGYVAVGDNNVTYPAIGVSSTGKAIMAFTLVGKDHYPSAAYVTLGEGEKSSAVRVLAEGVGPQDGFSGYNAFSASGVARPRWGDYGATAVVGDTVWMASEYIAQTCTLAQYVTPPIGSCGGTRAALGNWSTRVSAVKLA
jgi:hypothetical protein